MTEKLEEQLALVIEKSMGLAEKTGEFVIQEAPELIRQFLLFHTVELGLYCLLGLIALIAIPIVAHKFVKNTGDEFLYMLNILLIFPIMLIVCNIGSFLKVTLAPKLYLIEYFIK